MDACRCTDARSEVGSPGTGRRSRSLAGQDDASSRVATRRQRDVSRGAREVHRATVVLGDRSHGRDATGPLWASRTLRALGTCRASRAGRATRSCRTGRTLRTSEPLRARVTLRTLRAGITLGTLRPRSSSAAASARERQNDDCISGRHGSIGKAASGRKGDAAGARNRHRLNDAKAARVYDFQAIADREEHARAVREERHVPADTAERSDEHVGECPDDVDHALRHAGGHRAADVVIAWRRTGIPAVLPELETIRRDGNHPANIWQAGDTALEGVGRSVEQPYGIVPPASAGTAALIADIK